jgi:hypothetical protein
VDTYYFAALGEEVESSPKLFDIDILAHRDFVPPGLSLTGNLEVEILQSLRKAARWIHISLLVQQFFTEGNFSSHQPTTALSESRSR